MKTLKEINERLDQIAVELRNENADVEALSNEANELIEERKALMEAAEKRKATLDMIAKKYSSDDDGNEGTETKKEEKSDSPLASAEYRSAFYKKLLGKELTDAENRAYALSGVSGALPIKAAEGVIKKLSQYAPMLNEITLLHVPGQVKFAVEGTKTKGQLHTENSSITGDSDTLVTVSLGGYEITKLIQVSKSVEKMSIDAFEAWLIDMISEMIGAKIEDYIINGTGSSQPEGVDHITWSATNSVTVAANADLTAANVRAAIALLKGGYDKGAKFLMTKATLFGSFMPLQDSAKHDLVRVEGNNYYIYGYPVILSDEAPANEAILGNFKKYVGNLAEEVTVVSDFDINSNSNKYLGSAIFDGKPAVTEAFVKIKKATA